MKRNLNQNIKCDVLNCRYQDCNCCTLTNINISCTCDNDKCSNKIETICNSFREK